MSRLYILLLLLPVVLGGCKRRDLEYSQVKYADVVVKLDWSKSTFTPQEATVLFYDEKGNSPRTFHMVDNRGVFNLPVGKYSVIAYNDKDVDFDGIEFRGVDNYKTIEVFSKRIEKSGSYNKDEDEVVGQIPDMFACDSKDMFEVTQEMLNQTLSKSNTTEVDRADLTMYPVDVVASSKVTVHVKNMYVIRSGSQRGIFKGFAEGVTLWNRKTTSRSVTHIIKLSNSEYYPNDARDGLMSEQFTTFGLRTPSDETSQPIHFVFEAVLWDKEQTKFSYQRDVTKLVKVTVDLGVNIDVSIGIDPDNGDNPIPLPDVKPDDQSGGFKPGVDDWEEEEIIKPF